MKGTDWAAVVPLANEELEFVPFIDAMTSVLDALGCGLAALQLRPGLDCIAESMLACYEVFIRQGMIARDETTLLEAWLAATENL